MRKRKNITTYQLSKFQVDAILELRLQKLTAYGIGEIETEIKKLSNLLLNLTRLLIQKKNLYKLIINELKI